MAIKPIYSREDRETGELLFGLAPSDMEKVRLGYGCAHCLEDFTDPGYGGMHVAFTVCPVCKRSTSVSDFVGLPREWEPDPTDPYRS